jgi:hypothetical protein
VAAGTALRREQVIAGLLVGGVVVIVGYASGLGLRTTTTPAQAASPGQAQSVPNAGTPLPGAQLPVAAPPPTISIPGDLGAAQPVESGVAAQPVTTVPSLPSVPGTGTTAPTNPTMPSSTPVPGAPSTCLPGLAQNVADQGNAVIGGLPVVPTLTGSLGLTQSPDGSSPGQLNMVLYSVTGYCASPEPAQPGIVPLVSGG